MNRAFACGLALLLGTLAPTSSQALELEIQFLGLDLIYDGTDLYDATNILGGAGNPAEADPLTAVEFFVNGMSIGSLTTNVWADILIQSVTGIPVGGGGVNSSGNGDDFGFDLLVNAGGLALNLDQVFLFYTGGEIAIAGGTVASSIADQDLPFGLELDPNFPVTIAFSSANLQQVTHDGTFLTGFRASGTGNIRGTLVPEPSSTLLLAFGGLALAGWRRHTSRRRPEIVAPFG